MTDQMLTFDFIKRTVSTPGIHSETLTTLSPGGRARFTDPPTSKKAAAGISGRTERRILELFNDGTIPRHYGANDDELAALLPLYHPPTCKSARSRLSRAGLLIDSGLVRPSNRGKDSTVWKVPDA